MVVPFVFQYSWNKRTSLVVGERCQGLDTTERDSVVTHAVEMILSDTHPSGDFWVRCSKNLSLGRFESEK